MTGNEFDLTERDRIRQVLLAYMKEHKIGVPTLAERIRKSHPREMEVTWKTLQRFLGRLKPLPEDATADEIERAKPRRTHDMALIICKAFVENLPNKPTVSQALGEAAYAMYEHALPDDLPSEVDFHYSNYTSTLAIKVSHLQFAIIEEKSTNPHFIYDGVMFSLKAHTYIALMKDRLMRTPRIHRIFHEPPTYYFHFDTFEDLSFFRRNPPNV